MQLWYKEPAAVWTEALPVGNGRLGAMVFGRVDSELLQLNEATLWTGGPVGHNINPEAKNYLPQVRAALLNKEYDKAEQLAKKMQGLYSESYLPMADLLINEDFAGKQPTEYNRKLNISDAVSITTFKIDGVQYKREVFASAPAQVIVIKISADAAKKITATIITSSQIHFKNEVLKDYRICCESRETSLLGRKEVLTGKAKFGIFGDGKEVAQVAMAKFFKPGDFRAGYYRDQTFMFATGLATVEQFFAQLYADPDLGHDPFSAGRQMNSHFASPFVDDEGKAEITFRLSLTKQRNLP
jgi:hypothetical protein